MVGMILCFSVVARMKITYDGGSSKVLRKALKAAVESMCTSSMINTRYLPKVGGTITCSIRDLMSSIPLCDAASNSMIFIELPSLNARHEAHSLHASPSLPGFRQLMLLANMRAHEVLPTPREPQKR